MTMGHGFGVLAGMRLVMLNDLARMRLENICFFLVCLLLLALVLKLLWNWLRKDFPRLPRLTYFRSCAVVVLWGLLFLLILTMVAAARELMTPGAWEKHGTAYKLKDSDGAAMDTARQEHLERLRTVLWQYARDHAGKFPPHDFVGEIPDSTWQTLDPSGERYVYIPGAEPDHGDKPIVYEPAVYGDGRLVLRANGKIERMEYEDILKVVDAETK